MKGIEMMVILLAALASSANARNLGKRAGVRIDATAVEYMGRLDSQIADNQGSPKDLDSAPTNVFCFLDKAIVDKVYRPKPTGEGGKCGAIDRFYFNWGNVTNGTHMFLNKTIIRPFMETIERLIEPGEVIPVNISIGFRLFHNNMTLNDSNSTVHYNFIQTVNVTSNNNSWLELDITQAISLVWLNNEHQLPVIELTLRVEVDCINHKKVPIQFINPAEVELFKINRREKFINYQPLLVLFLEDKAIKQRIKEDKELAKEEEQMVLEGNDVTESFNISKPKRTQRSTDKCLLHDYTVNFSEINLQIILPLTLNIRKCAGNCSAHVQYVNSELGTNHAKIIANAVHLISNMDLAINSIMYDQQQINDPCCTPTEYRSSYLTFLSHDQYSVITQLFPELIVTGCGCR